MSLLIPTPDDGQDPGAAQGGNQVEVPAANGGRAVLQHQVVAGRVGQHSKGRSVRGVGVVGASSFGSGDGQR